MHTNSKRKSQRHGVINDRLKIFLATSHDHDKSIKNINLASEESRTAEKYSTLEKYVKDASDDLIQTKPLSIPHTTTMFYMNVTVVYDAQSFVVLIKKPH